LIKGDFNLTADNVSNFPYLCGFESQILRKVSPFCYVFTEEEILEYEYRQDLRYWYGTGIGAYNNASVQLPVLQGVVNILTSGPNTPVKGAVSGDDVVGPLTVAFTHDNQINELASILGIFDEQTPLPSDHVDTSRVSCHFQSALDSENSVTTRLPRLLTQTVTGLDLLLQPHQSDEGHHLLRKAQLWRRALSAHPPQRCRLS
jgi:hypothetical protein